MTELVLVLGSNEDAAAQLEGARAAQAARYGALGAASPCLSSPASDAADAPAYLNQAVVIRSALDRHVLKQQLREIETELGRVRPAPRPGHCAIDIDLLGCRCGVGEAMEIWDARAAAAPYARAVLAALPSVG